MISSLAGNLSRSGHLPSRFRIDLPLIDFVAEVVVELRVRAAKE